MKHDNKLPSGTTVDDAEATTGERAVRALDYHLNLLSWLQTKPALDLYRSIGRISTGLPQHDGATSRMVHVDIDDNRALDRAMRTSDAYVDQQSSLRLSADVALLSSAPTYFVTGDMGRIANLATNSLEPGTALMPMDLPTRKGIAYLSAGLWAADYGYEAAWAEPRDKKVLIRAVSWEHRDDITMIEDGQEVERSGVRYTFWTAEEHLRGPGEAPSLFKFWPFESSATTYGVNYSVAEIGSPDDFAGTGTVIPEVDWQRRFLLALWTLMGQEVAVVRPVNLDRARRRAVERLADKMPEIGDLKIVRLRREYNPILELADEEVRRPTGEREWTHRWWVRDHWAWRACGPNRSERRRVWIAPYIKGPEDKPLIDKDIIYSLER